MYESQAIDYIYIYVIMGIPFPLLKEYIKIPIYGQKQNSCSNSYSTFMHEFNQG